LNELAGIGDPYWYEWSVGLEYIIYMLNPDNRIKTVRFQSTEIKGLDDVVVEFTDNRRKYIQVKHSRKDEKVITFGDLVSEQKQEDGKTKIPLLKYLSQGWKKAAQNVEEVEVILYTNREAGDQRSTAKKSGIKRPSLKEFYQDLLKQLNSVKSFSEISFSSEWDRAWAEWSEQLTDLNDDEKLLFLKDLKIEFGQPDLKELEKELLLKIAHTFSISQAEAHSVFQSLDHALREWTVSYREKEAVDIEMVYEVLSKPVQDMVGDHNLPAQEPFFSSRKRFVEDLENELINGIHPVIFLTGPPGIGKTTIINELTVRHRKVIHLRFHAFRPITPDITLLPADAGRTTMPEALWGDLLHQLRDIFKGKLAKHKVPIRNDFLRVDNLRDNVIRLADEYSKQIGTRTVISIDGIDHAARAGIDRETFLNTLIPPDEIPEGICFLIAGQPPNAYRNYPTWLRAESEGVLVQHVEGIKQADIDELLNKHSLPIPSEQLDATARLIYDIADGNTLSAIFAAYEAMNCNCVKQLKERLEKRY